MNAVTCLTCNTRIESTHRHDFKGCACPEDSNTCVFVDGGKDYMRRCYGSNARWLEEDTGDLCGVAEVPAQ